MDKKFKEIETLIKTTVPEQVKPTSDLNAKPTYASALSANVLSSNEKQTNKSMIMTQKPDDIAQREKNLILYGYVESLEKDVENLYKFCRSINPNLDPVKIYRLGRKSAEGGATRPIKFIFSTREEAKSMLKDFFTAKRHDNLYLRNDYSIEERDEIRKLVEQAKKLNSESDRKRYWRVQGCPGRIYI